MMFSKEEGGKSSYVAYWNGVYDSFPLYWLPSDTHTLQCSLKNLFPFFFKYFINILLLFSTIHIDGWPYSTQCFSLVSHQLLLLTTPLSLSALGNCLFHTYICTYYQYVCGNLLSHNLMALAFWLPFYAAGPGLPLCQLWQFMTNKHFYIALPAIYCSVFCTYQQQRERERDRRYGSIICYIYFERHRWLLSLLAAGWGLWLSYSAFICINVWKTQTTQQTNKQTNKATTNSLRMHCVVSALRVSPIYGEMRV